MSVRGLFFDGVKVDSLYLFRFDIFNINLSSHVEICLLVDYSFDQLIYVIVLFSFLLVDCSFEISKDVKL